MEIPPFQIAMSAHVPLEAVRHTPQVQPEAPPEELEEPVRVSHHNLLVLLEQRRPRALELVTPRGTNTTESAQRQLALQEHHHYERVNQEKSVWAQSGNGCVSLSAASMSA